MGALGHPFWECLLDEELGSHHPQNKAHRSSRFKTSLGQATLLQGCSTNIRTPRFTAKKSLGMHCEVLLEGKGFNAKQMLQGTGRSSGEQINWPQRRTSPCNHPLVRTSFFWSRKTTTTPMLSTVAQRSGLHQVSYSKSEWQQGGGCAHDQ